MVREVIHAAAVSRPERSGSTPVVGIRVLAGDIRWNLGAGEEPDADALAIPKVSKDTTAVDVETMAIT